MSKLELKHLQHYPIGKNGLMLMIDTSHWYEKREPFVAILEGIFDFEYLTVKYVDGSGASYNDNMSRFKPILRPLSDLVKPCLPEGKIPILELAKIEGFTPTPYTIENQNGTFVLYGDWFCHPMEHFEKEYPKARFFFEIDTDNFDIDRGLEYNDESMDSIFSPCSNQLSLFEWLYEHHFDVKNLIEQNLAIDINTLQK